MTAEVLCFISAKGGSGKTVTSSALGTFLSSLGFKILLVDTDASTNGLTLLFLEQLLGRRRERSASHSKNTGLFEAREGVAPTQIEIDENLFLVPATFGMTETEGTDYDQFKSALGVVLTDKEKYDFIFLDAQAGTDSFAKIAAEVSDQCVIVSEYDPVSAQGIERLKVLFASVIDPGSTWTLFNKVLPEFTTAIGEGLSIARYLTPIPWDADVVRAFARRDLAINMKSPNPYTLAISQVAYNLFPDETGNAIESWRGSALKDVTTPVRERLEELDEVRHRLAVDSYRKRRFKFWSSVAGVVLLSVAPAYFLIVSSASLWGGMTIILLALTLIAVVNYAFSYREADSYPAIYLAHIEEERSKLLASLNAAESTLKLDAGYYERRRRGAKLKKPSPTSQ